MWSLDRLGLLLKYLFLSNFLTVFCAGGYRRLPENPENPLSVTREERDRQLEERSILEYNISRELLHPAVPQHAHSRIPHKPPGDEDVAYEAQCGATTSE